MVHFALQLAVSKIQHVHVQDHRKSEMHRMTPIETELEHLIVKSTLYTLNTFPGALILVRFALRLAISEIHVQGRRKLKMH